MGNIYLFCRIHVLFLPEIISPQIVVSLFLILMKPVSTLLPSCIFNFYFPPNFFSGTIEELRMRILTILDRTPSYQPSAAAAPAAAKLKSSNLLPNANIVGRQAELQQIGDLMEGYNKLFLQGMGGIGKSELAALL